MSTDRESVNARVARGRGEEISRLNKRVAELERQLAEARDEVRSLRIDNARLRDEAFGRERQLAEARAANAQALNALRASYAALVVSDDIPRLKERRALVEAAIAMLAALSPAPVTSESPPRPAPEEPR